MALAITSYQWYLFAHILAAAFWVGGGACLAALAMAARRQSNQDNELALVRLGTTIGGPFFGASGLVLLGFGIALVEKGNWGWDQAFVIWGLCAWAFSTFTGIGFYRRQQGRIEAARARGDNAAVRRALDVYYRVGRIDVLVLVSAVFAMATKPWL
jgi:uncharacterized membrane protein